MAARAAAKASAPAGATGASTSGFSFLFLQNSAGPNPLPSPSSRPLAIVVCALDVGNQRQQSGCHFSIRVAVHGRECVKTLEALMVQCIFRHVGSISRDFVDLKSRAIEPTRHVIWVLTHPRPGAASLVEPLLLTRGSANARQADGPFGVDRPIVRMLTVEQFAGAGWQPRSSDH